MSAAREERSSKRQRTLKNESIDFVRDKDYYLDDGNIILVTADDTAFKVHKSVLSRHSIVFRDMFFLANGNSSSSSESHENCEVLRVSDSKQDVVCLLRALYDNIVISPHELIELSRLLRISHKYLIHHFLKRTLECIERTIPTTYEGYRFTFQTLEHAVYGHDELNVGVTAIMTGIDIFLPTLYYKFSTILDPSEVSILPAPSIAKILTGIKPTLECLPDVFKIVKAKQRASNTCCSFSTCELAWTGFSAKFESYVAMPKWLYRPIDVLIRMRRFKCPKECSSCKDARFSLLDAEAKKFWDQLPKIYNVAESWDELQKKYKKLKELDNENSQGLKNEI